MECQPQQACRALPLQVNVVGQDKRLILLVVMQLKRNVFYQNWSAPDKNGDVASIFARVDSDGYKSQVKNFSG